MLNDLLVWKKIKEGDIKAFEQVFRLYYAPLCQYSAGITGEKETAEEIVQELFYLLWKERETIQIIQSVKAYLYKAVRNQSLHYCEHLRVREHYQHIMVERKDNHRNATPEDILELRELECIISEILNKLPERRRNIFGMHRFEGLKYKEIADKLSLSVKTVEAEMTKTYRLLRKEIEKYRLVL